MLVPGYKDYYRGVPYYFGIDPVCFQYVLYYVCLRIWNHIYDMMFVV